MTTKEQLEREISALQAKLDAIKLPSRRWYKWDEFLTTFGSCSCILTREINAPGSITVRRVTGGSSAFYLTGPGADPCADTFREFEYSTDLGKTWEPMGVAQ